MKHLEKVSFSICNKLLSFTRFKVSLIVSVKQLVFSDKKKLQLNEIITYGEFRTELKKHLVEHKPLIYEECKEAWNHGRNSKKVLIFSIVIANNHAKTLGHIGCLLYFFPFLVHCDLI